MTGAPGYDDVVVGRRSIRGFLDKPVPKALIAEILGVAMRAPSSFNNQCWNFSVVAGGLPVERNPCPQPRMHEDIVADFDIILAARQIEIAKQLFGAMGIARDDKDARQDWVLRGFRQFDAPVSIVVTYDRVLLGSDIAPFDCGAVTNALVNAAWSRGLGCVINSQGIMQSPVVREHARIPDDQVIMICVAMGWPDADFPANAVVSNRKSVDDAVRFVGFDD